MIDYFYQLNHRRLREKFGLERVEKHEVRVMAALEKRHAQATQGGI